MFENLPCGVINVYKEKGFTSSDVVVIIRGILRRVYGQKIKTGHTGTLDPMATGVLLVCVGKATKAADALQAGEKEYIAQALFGAETDTEDITGRITEENDIMPSRVAFEAAAARFCTVIKQTPPMYSAVKVDGQRLYKAARAGVEIERKAREVTIRELEVLDYSEADRTARIRVVCSAGTYIRTLIKDIAREAGALACMSALERTRSGDFFVRDALKLSEIETRIKSGDLLIYEPVPIP